MLYFILHTEQVVENTQILISDTDVLKKTIFALSIVFYIYTNNLAIIAVKKTASFNSSITVANRFKIWDQASLRYLKLTMENLIVLIISVLILLEFSEHFFLVFFNAETNSNLLLFGTVCLLTQVVINRLIQYTKPYLDNHILNYAGQITLNQFNKKTPKHIIDYRGLLFKTTFFSIGIVIYTFLGFSSPNQFFVNLFATQSIIFIGFSFALLFIVEFMILPRANKAKFIFIISAIELIFSLWNDPSEAEYMQKQHAQIDHQLHFSKWINHKKPVEGDTIPLIFIAAEGGGIRAMGWSLMAMNFIDKKFSKKTNYIYLISGVSGGSVGATMYVSLLKDKLHYRNQRISDSTIYDLISQDYLSNIVRGNMFKSPLRIFSPQEFSTLDRNKMLEDSWSNSYFDKTQSRTMDNQLLNIWSNDTLFQIPSLVLNCTLAETGEKAIISNLNFNNKLTGIREIYNEIDPNYDLKAKSAASLSARFPIVTSGGLIKSTKNEKYHLTDGGYNDNTGIETCLQVISQLHFKIDSLAKKRIYIKPYIFYLKNSRNENKSLVNNSQLAYETKSIIQSFYNSWDKESVIKSDLYTNLSIQSKLGVTFTTIELNRENHVYPLGWQLSKKSLNGMHNNINTLFNLDYSNLSSEQRAAKIINIDSSVTFSRAKNLYYMHKVFAGLEKLTSDSH
ncbi:patatin-like phospholipase family protein [Lacihabitans soyangensis]|nr:patatin-like phospholipase family protein [Lacihabitans soyangensis]